MHADRTSWASDHFDGRRFHNVNPRKQGFGGFLRWMATRDQGHWNERPANVPAPPPPDVVQDLRVTWVGHSTVLIQMDGLNILTDPIWSERASPVRFTGPRRRSNPGVRFEELPHINVVLLSHDHYDHMDLLTLRRLAHDHDPVMITALGNGQRLQRAGMHSAIERDWWETVALQQGLAVTLVPAKHFSGRGPFDGNKTLWCGFVLTSSHGNVYFAGDSGYGDHFNEIAGRFAPIRVAMLPIGAFRPEWFMGEVHCTPLEALRAHQVLGAQVSIAIHHSTFPLGDDGQNEAREMLLDHLRHGQPGGSDFWVLEPGEGRDVPALAGTELPLEVACQP